MLLVWKLCRRNYSTQQLDVTLDIDEVSRTYSVKGRINANTVGWKLTLFDARS